MKQEEMRMIIEKARDAWIAQDANAITQLFTPNGELIVPGQKWQGQERIRQEVTNFALANYQVKIEIRRIIFAENQAAVEWYYEDTDKASGRRNQADDVIMIDFQNGYISRWREYFDTTTPASNQS
ncbi:nuclear transport factor 2 family protein [Iningainema tapete]|uniref:Nuclear transport factor 2 family protein n=1 Tax=Iningainema tapete BLCC-T55 TaxID=2748662 RepID=A0A8J7C0M9_9CYAN|nr:nuclear transport factor 2 family protein [Iningainema tapete]MBD2778338.1 nuclear transport factor 2 family protein [Iningainema tapete BLCC-T55]